MFEYLHPYGCINPKSTGSMQSYYKILWPQNAFYMAAVWSKYLTKGNLKLGCSVDLESLLTLHPQIHLTPIPRLDNTPKIDPLSLWFMRSFQNALVIKFSNPVP